MKVRVLVVDDHPHAREAIGEILAEDDGFEVIGYAENGERAVELTELWMPDLILMDIQMPGKDGLETTREIKLRYPYVKIVLITVSDDAAHLFEALKQGAQGYLLKNLEPGTWLEYLRAIASDEAPLSSELALRILQEFPLTKKRCGRRTAAYCPGARNSRLGGERHDQSRNCRRTANFRSDGEKSFEKYFAQAAFGKSCPINALRVGTGMDRYAEKITQGRL